jgi:uncharacterized phosphosugar-binding protein
VAVSFIGGENRSVRRNPPIFRKSNIDNRDNKNNSSSNPQIQNKPEKDIERY